jgi:hypothetical protein
LTACTSGEIQVQPGHEVGVGVVVDDRGVLVGPGHAVDVEPAVAAEKAEVLPQPSGFGQDLGPDVAEQAHVAGDAGVAPDRVGDIGVDVILRGARLEIGRGLLAVDGAPWESAPFWLTARARSRARSSMLCRKRSRLRAILGWV